VLGHNCFEGIGTPLLGSIERKEITSTELDAQSVYSITGKASSQFHRPHCLALAMQGIRVARAIAALSQRQDLIDRAQFYIHAPVTLGSIVAAGSLHRFDGSLGGGVLPLGLFDMKGRRFVTPSMSDVLSVQAFTVKAPPRS
jgi:hypothetical protein